MRWNDEAAFSAFVVARRPQLVRIAAVMLGSASSEAEDVVQAALERLAAKWGLVRSPDAYVRRTISTLVIDNNRRTRRRPEVLVGDNEDLQAGELTTTNDPANLLESADWIMSTVRGLPLRQRTVLALRYIDDLSDAEIASVLKMPLGTVKSDCYRALQDLRRRAYSPNSMSDRRGGDHAPV